MSDAIPYNPLEKKHLGASVAEALLGKAPRPLGKLTAFKGAGVYAIYYKGDFAPYLRTAELNRTDDPQAPIYVGKAIPSGARKGVAITSSITTTALYRRLKEHAESIKSTKNLLIDDFLCRYLVVDDIWIPLGESLLIAHFSPLWNTSLDGFGNHDPGAGRYKGLIPRWDVLHPGRDWAAKCATRPETPTQIAADVQARLNQEPSLARSRFLVEQQRGTYKVIPKLD
jgi:hypothetical protein